MVILYNIGIGLYYLLVLIISPFKRKAKLWIEGRSNWQVNLKAAISPNYPVAWFHCASLGEFEQGRPLIEAYRESHPGHRILLTFFSPSGYEVRKNYSGADYVFYLPLDTPWNAKKFLAIVNPVIAVFIKYEFWYHHLRQLKRNKIPTFVISAIFRPNQVFFKWYGAWYRKVLFGFNHIFVQNEISVLLLQKIGISNATVAGDTRFDRVSANAQKAEELPVLESFCGDSNVIVAGSTWPKDDELLVEYIKSAPENLKLVLVPHEIDPKQIEAFEKMVGVSTIRYTRGNKNVESAKILIIDMVGILAAAYRYATIAYVGGGFGVGIHNTLEPATYGIPVLFGPNHQKFNEATELIGAGAGFSVSNAAEFRLVVSNLLSNEEQYKSSCRAAKTYITDNVGATNRILEELIPLKK